MASRIRNAQRLCSGLFGLVAQEQVACPLLKVGNLGLKPSQLNVARATAARGAKLSHHSCALLKQGLCLLLKIVHYSPSPLRGIKKAARARVTLRPMRSENRRDLFA